MLLTHISANHTYVEAEQLLDLGMYREELRERRAGASAAARALGSIERVWIGEKGECLTVTQARDGRELTVSWSECGCELD
jgi:hypothetical protein